MNRISKKNLLIFFLISAGLLVSNFVLAQGFGTNEVGTGLNGALATTDPRTIVGRIINIALGFLGVIAVGLIIYAGFLWMSSGGDEEKLTKAKSLLKNAVIGLVIVLSSWAIATFIISRLSGATNGSSSGCLDGESMSCGCGGAMVCSGGSYGSCVGSNCSGGGGGNAPTSCDSNINPGCQAAAQICAPSDYCDAGDCGCKPRGNLGDPCDSDLTNATCDADNNHCSEYLTCNPTSCTCFGPPVITAISPNGGFCDNNPNQTCKVDSDCATTCNIATPNGAVGNFITIIGKNFGSYSATTSKVVFEGNGNPRDGRNPVELNSACANTWRDTEIVIAVPSGASVGSIKVVNADNLEDTTGNTYGPDIADFQVNNISRPGLCYLSPNTGALSSQVGYQGINLFSGSAYFGNYQSNVQALSSSFSNPVGLTGTSTTPNIRSGQSGSFVQNNINGHAEKSNFLSFTKEPEPGEGPFISSFLPTAGNAGQYVTIRGNGFGGARGSSQVFFGNTEAAYDFPDMCLNSVWKDNQIVVKVPAGLVDGYQTIKIVRGTTTIDTQKLNPNTFHSDANLDLSSSICKIEPEFGPIATPVTFWGEYFGQLNNVGLVHFNNQKSATGTIAKDGRADTIQAKVPVGSITGPARVIKNSKWGNEVNFSIGECSSNSDCGTKVCCPQNTYGKGRCVDTLDNCFINIPTSVFEWSFNTGFSTTTPNPYAYSCSGLASYFGSCQTGATCPNVPGTCSPYAGGGSKIVGACDYSCSTVSGCGELGLNNCTYDASLDKCVKNGAGATCDLPTSLSYTLGGKNFTTPQTCNKDKHWEITIPTSCPNGWTRSTGNRCVSLTSDCSVCSTDFTCQNISEVGHCVSAKICAAGATCSDNPNVGEPDKCIVPDQPKCDCCCTIGQDARDCCAPLTCQGTCGSDTGKTTGATLGSCGGCASVGTTAAEHDAACNCADHGGQFCDTSNTAFPSGVCTDCSNLTGSECADHSNACCLDSKKTATSADDICRGGDGTLISSIPGNPSFGYCAYYDCSATNPTQCASSTPVKIGNYPSIGACTADCVNSDPCPGLDFTACSANSRCCFNSNKTPAPGDDSCTLGTAITGGADNGYCAYYNCEAIPLTNENICASSTPVRLGTFDSLTTCVDNCANPPTGPGLTCAGSASSTCATDKCTFAGFGCFSPSGQLGTLDTDCGTCCCQPGATTDACTALNPKLQCLADKGNCSGASRGLCCGCSSDNECGSPETVGCGQDTCCEARPAIVSTSPAHMEDEVCRNSVIQVNFNQKMDISSLQNNIMLLEERVYGNGVCPSGTFVAEADSIDHLLALQSKGLITKILTAIKYEWKSLAMKFSDQALADTPNSNNLYCAVPGTASGETTGETSSASFAPRKLLNASSNYYFVVLGDAALNSQSGVLSYSGIGFNGLGYLNVDTSSYIPGENISLNGKNYPNSQIIKFSTLSDQGPMAGICAINDVKVSPSSYLFNTTENGLDEKDADVSDKTFDTVVDKDKVFTAQAYSLGGQPIQPTTGYFWTWTFQNPNPAVASILPVTGLARNKVFVSATSGATDAEAQVKATVNMSNFSGGICASGTCSCTDEICSNNCCNVYSGGNNYNHAANIYVFSCKNTWPPVAANGLWSPWADNCTGSIGGSCSDYNYKFYYCRDAGTSGTLDDLPAIINRAVIRGQGSNLVCSTDKNTCSNIGSACGPDQNNDGSADGLCIWSVLKESYFFREASISGGDISSVTDLQTGGAVRVNWQSSASQVGSYKVYYLKSGKGAMLEKAVGLGACTLSGNTYSCSTTLTGLTNNVPYVFKLSVISTNKVESPLSVEKTITPTDKTPPATPGSFGLIISSSTAIFKWNVIDGATSYRLYHGIKSGAYGESFDSLSAAATLSFNSSQFEFKNDYFAVSALDSYKNESAKSQEIFCNNGQCAPIN